MRRAPSYNCIEGILCRYIQQLLQVPHKKRSTFRCSVYLASVYLANETQYILVFCLFATLLSALLWLVGFPLLLRSLAETALVDELCGKVAHLRGCS
jgi:hypothetical protein